jgi:hypothetical protein
MRRKNIIDLVSSAVSMLQSDRIDEATRRLFERSQIEDMSFDDLAAQIEETERTLTSLKTFRDGAARGSSKRADFVSSIKRLKSWQDRLQRKFDAAVEARKSAKNK